MRTFISYASEDRDLAEQVSLALTGHGYEVFFDRESLAPAGDYHERIRAAVEQSDVFVFLVSHNSISPGSYALTELKYARAKWPHPKGIVLPVMVGQVPWESIPGYLKAVTVLEPEGSIPAEVLEAVSVVEREHNAKHQTSVVASFRNGNKQDKVSSRRLLTDRARRLVLSFIVLLLIVIFAFFAANPAGIWADLRREGRIWQEAITTAEKVPLYNGREGIVNALVARLGVRVIDEYRDHFDETRLQRNPNPNRYTAWTAAQCASALLGVPDSPVNAENLAEFVRDSTRQSSSCSCWTELSTDPASPQHLGISFWILYSLAQIRQSPTDQELSFLRETQDGTGGWTMFPMPYDRPTSGGLPRPQGSSFATPWGLLAMAEILRNKLIGRREAETDLRKRARHAMDFLLDRTNRDRETGLWPFYPGWSGSTKVSLANSGLVIFATHRYFDQMDASERKAYEAKLTEADHALLRSLPLPPPNVSDMDSFAINLPYEPIRGNGQAASRNTLGLEKVDSIQSLQLPWLLIGLQDAYSKGTYAERVRAIKFVDQALMALNSEIDAALREKWWIAPEVLLALRYLRDPSYLRHQQ